MFDIRKLEDINLNEIMKKQDYYDKFVNGDINDAHKMIEDNQELKFKVINAENLNKLIEHILYLENLYDTDFTNILNNHLSDYQINIEDLIYLKQYDNNKKYKINNFVLYNNDIYFCYKNTTQGIVPTNSNYWIYLGLKGEKSNETLGVKFAGNWNNTVEYKKFDMVAYNNVLYVAKNNNKNKVPNAFKDNWFPAIGINNSAIIVSRTVPINQQNKSIWIQIL